MDKLIFKFLTRKVLLFIIIVLSVILVIFINKYLDTKYAYLEYRYIPHIELGNSLQVLSGSNVTLGSIKGFVVFDNRTEQPKNLRQYYVIEGQNKLDKNLNQYFTVEEIVVLNSLPPKTISKAEVLEKNKSSIFITLEDKEGTKFLINKISGEVVVLDNTGDETKLITDNWDYREFMQEFLK